MKPIQLVVYQPGHFHASLVLKERYEGVDDDCLILSSPGPDLDAFVGRVDSFNSRAQNPTQWRLSVQTDSISPRSFQGLPRGSVVVLACRNAEKLSALEAAVDAGLHVLADKPWIIEPSDWPRLQWVLQRAAQQRLVLFDMMTERFEVTALLMRECILDADLLGPCIQGSVEEPGLSFESVHFLRKLVAGQPLRRPTWFFDVHQQGQGLSDVGTHLVDLALWMSPDRGHMSPSALQILKTRAWPTKIGLPDFEAITGENLFPHFLESRVQNAVLHYDCNNEVFFSLGGQVIRIQTTWDIKNPLGESAGDTHLARYRGARAWIEVRQKPELNALSEVYVRPQESGNRSTVRRSMDCLVDRLQTRFPGLALAEEGTDLRFVIPQNLRVGHEGHFAEVARQFFRYVRMEETFPEWEESQLLMKYAVTTRGTQRSTA